MPDAESGPLTRGLRAAGGFLLRLPRALALLLALLWAALIWSLSAHAVPIATQKSLLWEFLSNLAHAPLFGLLALFLAGACLRERGRAWPRPWGARSALVLVLVSAYGLLDEWHQSRTPGRDASPFDALTDAVAAALVLWIVAFLARPAARERALLARLALGILLCAASAGLATLA